MPVICLQYMFLDQELNMYARFIIYFRNEDVMCVPEYETMSFISLFEHYEP